MKAIQTLELNKILMEVSTFAATDGGKQCALSLFPDNELSLVLEKLQFTKEAYELLFTYGADKVEYFPPLLDKAERAKKGSTLSPEELTDVSCLLRAARILYSGVRSFSECALFQSLTQRLVPDERLERDIGDKIIGGALADTASDKLFTIRREIRLLGERIRLRLLDYLSGEKKYLQEDIVTMRNDRYVLPVKAEYKRNIKGFVHDRSASGATVFIEPEEVLEMNNELRSLSMDEKEEEERILKELSARVGLLQEELKRDEEILSDADCCFARAEYAFHQKAVCPKMGDKGEVTILNGSHPLLEKKTAVPVTVSVGKKERFLLISGANTGGKTVTLKMCGLFCLMAACGLFVPAEEANISVFDGVYCDIGDSQSIEENLSTFSSHILNIKYILENAKQNSFVLIDEPGGGTDPEEGQALAQAIVEAFMQKGCRGIITTHFSSLKEFAYQNEGIVNGSMEFDMESFRPLYHLRIGSPGSSNALIICSKLGLDERVIESARGRMSQGAKAFERTVRAAEESRVQADEAKNRAREKEAEWNSRLLQLKKDEEKFLREKERFYASSKAEAKRVVREKTQEAEEILSQIEELFERETLSESDLIRARTLKNKMQSGGEEEEKTIFSDEPVNAETLKVGDGVFVSKMNAEGVVLKIKREKGTAQVQCGAMKVESAIFELYPLRKGKKQTEVKVVKNLKERADIARECNVIGQSVSEALEEVENFLDSALVQNLDKVRIVHGMGTGKLKNAIHDYLKKHERVKEFRLGVYGEGESGVTVVMLK